MVSFEKKIRSENTFVFLSSKTASFFCPNTISNQIKLTSETLRVGGFESILPSSGFVDWFGGNILREHSDRSLSVVVWARLKPDSTEP